MRSFDSLRALGILALTAALAACAGPVGDGDVGAIDAARDTARDGAPSIDARIDVATDAATDATVDIAQDVRIDAPRDAPPIDAGPSSSRQSPRMLGENGAPNGFFEYLPPGYEDGAPRPVLIFWHGIGENGNGTTELRRVLAAGPPALIARDAWPADRPFIVLSAQHSGGGCPSSREIHTFIGWALANYRVDPARVYLTGLSCGAIGVWSYLGEHRAEVVSAAVLIAGNPGPPDNASSAWGRAMCNLGDLAIWAVHGDADSVVNIGSERETMNNLLACPAPPRRETHWNVIAGGGHDTWTRTYDLRYGFEIYDFLLRNPRP